MKTFNKYFLPEEIRYNNKTYLLDRDKTNSFRDTSLTDTKNCVMVNVLSRNLRHRTDLHGLPYAPTKWIYCASNNRTN